jgi:adenosylcobinamide-phosphate synthase
LVIIVTAVIAIPLYYLTGYLNSVNSVVYLLVSAYLLKNTFSLRGLWQAVQHVKDGLRASRLNSARAEITALVQRDPRALNEIQLMSAAIESCAENLCDSFVAPLLYFALFGLTGAVVYRIVNTFDAMIGYHGEWEYTGKFAARLDDVVNYMPARLSGIFIVVAAAICRWNPALAWRTMLSQHNRTESPNAGWTMSAMAGSLEIQLEKAGHYSLGDNKTELSVEAVGRSQTILLVAASVWGLLVTGTEVCFALAS